MNKNINLAVAGAVLASASIANAGIIIPAGDWTLDVSGNVNAYTSWGKTKGTNTIVGGIGVNAAGAVGNSTSNSWGNGLLPNFIGFTGNTRQNDLDVSFTISLQPGSAATTALNGGTGGTGGMSTGNGGINNRQAFITFGDKSWGSVKIGKDLGIFASDAILNDITLLGVGAASAGNINGAASNTSLGRIGYGYIYADWKPQIAYTTPNFNGLQATVGISQAFVTADAATIDILTKSPGSNNAAPAYEGKASYSFAANDVTGKVWVSGIAQKVNAFTVGNDDPVSYAGDIGANVNFAGFGLTGYYYNGSGIGITGQQMAGYGLNAAGTHAEARDSEGGYVQATYILPTKTKLAISYGESNLDKSGGDVDGTLIKSNEMWSAGLYHPLTKHVNLVAEYNNQRSENQQNQRNTANVGSLGAILFF